MPADLTIQQARLVLPDRVVTGDLIVEDGVISEIGPQLERTAGEVIDGEGLTVLPGAIDAHVSFRDPSPNTTEDFASGSRAAVLGGVTSFLDAPANTPPCTSIAALEDKLARAAEKSLVHYGFFIGATAHNLEELKAAERACGIKLYLGDTTGEMLVSDRAQLEAIFAGANKLIAVHAEDESRLAARATQYAESTDVRDHPRIRDEQASLEATRLAIELALKHGHRLHLLHTNCAEQVAFLRGIDSPLITAEVSPQHLFMDADEVYARIGTLAQCNPPVRTKRHGDALWQGLVDGVIGGLSSDHAPHPLHLKRKHYPDSPSGMPMVEWTLPLLLDQVHQGQCTLRDVARWTSETPASWYSIPRKGRIEVGYDGDLAIVDTEMRRTITHANTRSGCGWSPWDGHELVGWPVITVVLGAIAARDGQIVDGVKGRALTFRR